MISPGLVPTELTEVPLPSFKLQKLSVRHKEALSLLAQGVKRQQVASMTQFVPEYLTWLLRQEVCREYLAEIREVVDFRLEALTEESVDAIQEVLANGSMEDRLKAAKLQLETQGRVGAGKGNLPPGVVASDHLEQLASRLVGLLQAAQSKVHSPQVVIEGVSYESSEEGSVP